MVLGRCRVFFWKSYSATYTLMASMRWKIEFYLKYKVAMIIMAIWFIGIVVDDLPAPVTIFATVFFVSLITSVLQSFLVQHDTVLLFMPVMPVVPGTHMLMHWYRVNREPLASSMPSIIYEIEEEKNAFHSNLFVLKEEEKELTAQNWFCGDRHSRLTMSISVWTLSLTRVPPE